MATVRTGCSAWGSSCPPTARVYWPGAAWGRTGTRSIRAVAVFGPDGRALFRSRALEILTSEDRTSSMLVVGMERLALSVIRSRSGPARKSTAENRTNTVEVHTGLGRYRLWASPLRPTLLGAGAVLVQVERANAMLPRAETVQARFGLTHREAQVALLLAEGPDNQAVAERLSISPHTVRRHTERVLRGLDISSRAAVTTKLLQQPSFGRGRGRRRSITE